MSIINFVLIVFTLRTEEQISNLNKSKMENVDIVDLARILQTFGFSLECLVKNSVSKDNNLTIGIKCGNTGVEIILKKDISAYTCTEENNNKTIDINNILLPKDSSKIETASACLTQVVQLIKNDPNNEDQVKRRRSRSLGSMSSYGDDRIIPSPSQTSSPLATKEKSLKLDATKNKKLLKDLETIKKLAEECCETINNCNNTYTKTQTNVRRISDIKRPPKSASRPSLLLGDVVHVNSTASANITRQFQDRRKWTTKIPDLVPFTASRISNPGTPRPKLPLKPKQLQVEQSPRQKIAAAKGSKLPSMIKTPATFKGFCKGT